MKPLQKLLLTPKTLDRMSSIVEPTLSRNKAERIGHPGKRQSQNCFNALMVRHPPLAGNDDGAFVDRFNFDWLAHRLTLRGTASHVRQWMEVQVNGMEAKARCFATSQSQRRDNQ